MNSNKGLSTSCDRASSQISIYNYPAHLNPFHDEDNHKRLRFWNFTKGKDDNRRRSFSIGNLRDVWAFRSFTLKKKKSSTLGIQKTSESPPVMRRNLDSNTLYQHPGQQTTGNRGLIQSLQNVHTPMEMEMNRANGNPIYRGSGRYYRCLTPQLQQNHTIRSSYTSLASTNPFETDIESDCGSLTDSVVKKSMRKKRRAPLPPPRNMVGKPSAQEVSKDTNSQSTTEIEPNIDIKSLTVEIERFVNHTNENSTNPPPPSKISLEPVAQHSNTLETTPCTSKDNNNVAPKNIVICKVEMPTREFHMQESSTNPPPPSKISLETFAQHSNSLETTPITIENNNNTPPKKIVMHEEEVRTSNMDSLPTYEAIDKEIKVENANGYLMNTLGHSSNGTISKQKHGNIAKENNISKEEIKPTVSKVDNLVTNEQINKSQQIVNVKSNPIIITERTYNTSENDTNHIVSKKIEVVKEETLPIIPNVDSLPRRERPVSSNIFKIADQSKQSTYNTLEKDSNNIVCKHEHVNINTEKQISKEKIVPNVVYLPTCEQLDQKHKVDNVNNNLIKVTDHSRLGQSAMYKNNNIVESTEYLNEPLTILENNDTNTESAQLRTKTAKPKSVKEIIDSINRSQQLLKESAAKGTHVYSTSLYLQKDTSAPIVDQNENSHEVVCTNTVNNSRLSLDSQAPLQQSYFQKSKINKEVFQCRESSPTASNLDWNPLPKPKRINSDSTK